MAYDSRVGEEEERIDIGSRHPKGRLDNGKVRTAPVRVLTVLLRLLTDNFARDHLSKRSTTGEKCWQVLYYPTNLLLKIEGTTFHLSKTEAVDDVRLWQVCTS